jgi:hypothetical protein
VLFVNVALVRDVSFRMVFVWVHAFGFGLGIGPHPSACVQLVQFAMPSPEERGKMVVIAV